jgi:dienelactone hydrolase
MATRPRFRTGPRPYLFPNTMGREYYLAGTEHAFCNERRPEVFNAPAANLAWERTLLFLEKHL